MENDTMPVVEADTSYGVLAPIVAAHDIVTVIDTKVYVGENLKEFPIDLAEPDMVRRLAQRLCASAGKRLDDTSSYVDVRLEDGTRLQASLEGHGLPTIIRLQKDYKYSLLQRERLGMVTPAQAKFLSRFEMAGKLG